MSIYRVEYVSQRPISFNDEWQNIPSVPVDNFRVEGSDHKPVTLARLVYSDIGLHGRFDIHDKYVLTRYTQFHDPVWTDSAVEFFIKPKTDEGYINFEMNGGGALTCLYIRDPTRINGTFKDFVKLTEEDGKSVIITTSHPGPNEPNVEIEEEINWWVEFTIPFTLLQKYMGPLGDPSGQTWTGNFYKCADECSHPHWASWSPVSELNFHLPQCFGNLVFAAKK